MATRTFRGTIDGDWQTAGNWLEGAVPVEGDDVVFDASSPNCTLSADTAKLRSFVATNFTNTFALGNYDLIVGSASFTGSQFDSGVSGTYTTTGGKIQHWSANAIPYANYNTINCNNTSLQYIDAYFNSSTYNRCFSFVNNFYCKDFIQYNSGWGHAFYTTNSSYTINIYGNLTLNANTSSGGNGMYYMNSFNNSINLNGTNKLINGGGNNYIFYTISTAQLGININGNYTLQRDLNIIALKNNSVTYFNLTANGTLNTNNYYIRLSLSTTIKANGYDIINFGNNSIDRLEIIPYISYGNTFAKFYSFVVNKELRIIGNSHLNSNPAAVNNYITNATGTTQTITLGNNCQYQIINASLKNIVFNRPIKAFNTVLTNCSNITSGEYPEICVNVY